MFCRSVLTGRPVAKAKTRMSGPGNRRLAASGRVRGGFTLLELLLVVALVALAGAGVAFALRDTSANQLEREGQRLAALLEAGRVQSRATGDPVFWRADADGFELIATTAVRTDWLVPGTTVDEPRLIVLGPEPIIERLNIVLQVGGYRVRVVTDGLRPFDVQAGPVTNQPAATP